MAWLGKLIIRGTSGKGLQGSRKYVDSVADWAESRRSQPAAVVTNIGVPYSAQTAIRWGSFHKADI